MVKNAIKVFARLKPQKSRKNTVNYQVYHRPKENLEEDFLLLLASSQRTKDYPDNRPESWNFSFFRIFEESTTQEDVFVNLARPVVESALDGYNGTIFAYGQTASGKTYTITGEQRSDYGRGIIPRCLEYLFDVIRKRPENVYSVEVAYLEIYNENGYDLLDRRQQRELAVTRLEDLPRVTIQEDETSQLHLKNLTFHCVGSAEDALELLMVGENNRITTETPMNPQSSRSHCVFTIVVTTKQFGAEQYKRAKVHIVDLAGSERVYKCSISGTILAEAKHINLSLHYLEQVIVCLGQESAGHIPYRNSFLTSILRDSLGGNCVTVMLATLSVESYNLEETVSTCRFAQRVALIRNDVKIVLEKDTRSENALLKLENERLKEQIKALTEQMSSGDLTAEDKRNLDSQVTHFLESNAEIHWDNNPKKIQYCFETFKRFFEMSRDPNSCLKKVEYYKNMVVQRDKEISLLIHLMKKEEEKKGEKTKEEDYNHLRLSKVGLENGLKSMENRPSNQETFVLEDKRSTVANTLEKNEISILHHVAPKKQKRKLKVLKPAIQNQANDGSQNIIQHPERDDKEKTNCSQRSSLEESSLNKLVSPNISCSIVNLTLSNLTENESNVPNQDINQHSLRKNERKKSKSKEIQASLKTNIGTKHNNILSVEETKIKDEEDLIIDLQKNKTKIGEAKHSSEEIDYSVPFYQRFLNFNVPEDPTRSSRNDSIHSFRVSARSNTESASLSTREELKVTSVESGNGNSPKHTTPVHTHSLSNDRCDNTKNNSRSKGNTEPLNSELENIRSERIEEKESVANFKSENSFAFNGKLECDRNDKCFESSLPLTGDPEIDEEIIAFYKAKRSGGVY